MHSTKKQNKKKIKVMFFGARVSEHTLNEDNVVTSLD